MFEPAPSAKPRPAKVTLSPHYVLAPLLVLAGLIVIFTGALAVLGIALLLLGILWCGVAWWIFRTTGGRTRTQL